MFSIFFTIHGAEKICIIFMKYSIKIQVGTNKSQPKNFEIAPKIQNKNPKDKIAGIAGKIKMLVIGEAKDIAPKLKIIIGKVKICAESVADTMSVFTNELIIGLK